MRKNIMCLIMIFISCNMIFADGFDDYRIKRRIKSRQRKLLKNSLFLYIGNASGSGNASDLVDNGLNLSFGYQRRLVYSITQVVSFNLSSHNAYNKLLFFKDNIGMADEVTDVIFSQWGIDYGIKIYVPVFKKFSIHLQSTVGFTNSTYDPTIAPEGDQQQLTDQFADDLKTFLKGNDYATEGLKPAFAIGGGLEWLLFYQFSVGVNVLSRNTFDGGNVFSAFSVNGSLNFYFEEILLHKDLFK